MFGGYTWILSRDWAAMFGPPPPAYLLMGGQPLPHEQPVPPSALWFVVGQQPCVPPTVNPFPLLMIGREFVTNILGPSLPHPVSWQMTWGQL